MNKYNCLVKIIVNPVLDKTINLTFATSKHSAKLKIILNHSNDLTYMLEELRHLFSSKFHFTLFYNWKATPKEIRENKVFQEELQKIFNNYESINELNKLVNIVKKHINLHGSAPNFKIVKDKDRYKIHNYIKTSLGISNLTLDESLRIAKCLIDENNQ